MDIFWLDDLQYKKYESFFANLQPNRLSYAEFEKKIINRYGDITYLGEDCFSFIHNDELIKVCYNLDDSLSVSSNKNGTWGIPTLKWELIFLYGVSANNIASQNSIALLMYKIAIAKRIEEGLL